MQSVTAPPEVTSALVHNGPGARSLIEASGAWRHLGTYLDEYADDYVAALSSLVDSWRGRSAAAMVQSAEPYLVWLRATAQQCRRTAVSMQQAAAAFEAVRTAVAPTAAIKANRTRRVQLLASNRFGTNSAAIAENESQYLGMWTNNTAAMTRYRAASAQATTLASFSSPKPAASGTTSAASTLASAEPSLPAFDPNASWTGLANTYANQFVSSGFPINLLSYLAQNTSAQALQNVNTAMAQGLAEGESALIPAMPLGGAGRAGRRRPYRNACGGNRCRGEGGPADRATRRGGVPGRDTGAGSVGVVGHTAAGKPVHDVRRRPADHAADGAAIELRGQWLAQAQAAEVRGPGSRFGAAGPGHAQATLCGLSRTSRDAAGRTR